MLKINEKITAPELLVIDENGEKIGALPLLEALNLAKGKGLDLIEIGPTSTPPVAKIMSFDKYRYMENKKMKKQRAQQKFQELKQIRISARAAEHDLQIKVKKVNEFLKEGNMVEIMLVMRGREKANKDWARQRLENFLKMVDPDHRVILAPKYGFKGFVMQIIKNK